MDFYLRCNSLKCREQLKERAVVTTCSHIFCLHCAGSLGLSHPTANERICPACQTVLVNPDDAVATALNPTEDYKTSVLSGLDPNTIMECAGRALLFWTYQTTQEIFYQEYLAKTLTEKYTNLNTQMDKVIHNANSEISALQARISADMQTAQDQLRKKNQELVDMYREKCKKFTQMTNLYNILKSRAMRSQMQTAATDTVSQALDSLTASRNNVSELVPRHTEAPRPPQTPLPRQSNVYPVNREGVEQLHRHQRSGTGSSKGRREKTDVAAMPPPSRPIDTRSKHNQPAATPQHRTRLVGPSRPSTGRTQLPHDSIMLERFQAEAGPADALLDTRGSLRRTDAGMQIPPQRHSPTEHPRLGSFFDSTII
ncbi:cyclin [Aspergillus piperis CBS 112811]|uniref:Cyclin n=1 Tax=Aspergillus piperis CBS 112811 TaxID=1448313 RepID=A0A8G1R366_9EURO|nr:cyclin [Aspergillus piperis CBS 112811]RAH57672.1 cyclin [Aspergillus piperis CBS 112811]